MNTEIPVAQEWLSPKQVGELLGISTITLATWRREGTGPTYARLTDAPNGTIRYRRSDVDAWLESKVPAAV
ncbi:helix-turn-helix domain-containing protein [Streptomyces sp. NPDC005438]|uniref:helix-turn-helix transcriptional regulator n=1 Tax=Streptomyces sp. NPDC005438 TaxID=3156880 RepID=UPI0033A42447